MVYNKRVIPGESSQLTEWGDKTSFSSQQYENILKEITVMYVN